jgi:baculoviral IAP repeat-containing protein 6
MFVDNLNTKYNFNITEQKIINITKLMEQIIPLVNSNTDYIKDTCIIPYINQYIYDVSPLEVEKRKDYYIKLFELFNEIYKLNVYNDNFRLNKISEQSKSLVEFPEIVKFISNIQQNVDKTENKDGEYINTMKEFAFDMISILGSKRYKFIKEVNSLCGFGQDFGRRVAIEMRNLKLNLTKDVSITSSVFFRQDEGNMTVMKFIIIPHPDTPYAYGCFEFDMYLPVNYPNSPPHVEIITTGGGKFRFNPNLYDNGKVCLSLLGTWSGSGGESWSKESNIYQVLIAIQSVIFCEEPYFNEPGYERDRGNAKGAEANNKYNEPVRLNTMKLAMLEQLKNPSFGFGEVIKNHFRLKKNDIYKKLDDWEKISSNKTNFKKYYDELKGIVDKL